jgi:ubiquinone/menaquinone biosynthesis C-methylase UbiE
VTERLYELGKRFARFATDMVVARPRLWRLFRGPLRKQFDWIAAGWEEGRSPEHGAVVEAALARLDSEPRRLLDLGTGTGIAARLLADRYPAAEVVGVDLSREMIEEARKRVPDSLRDRIRFEVADASALPFGDGEFDLVVLLNMIPFFDELARVTASGGAIVFASSYGAETPIYVPPATIKEKLGRLGFTEFDEVAAGEGTSFIAARRAG